MNSLRLVFRSKIFWAIFLILIFYITFLFSDKYAKILQLKEDIQKLEIEVEELKEKNQALTNEIELLKSDNYIEKKAREELDLVKPGEIILKATDK